MFACVESVGSASRTKVPKAVRNADPTFLGPKANVVPDEANELYIGRALPGRFSRRAVPALQKSQIIRLAQDDNFFIILNGSLRRVN